VVIWYIYPRFGTLHQEKSGIPEPEAVRETNPTKAISGNPFFEIVQTKIKSLEISQIFYLSVDFPQRVTSRVTRLGEFSPTGRLFSLGDFFSFWAHF
jgi:hypothetical protein